MTINETANWLQNHDHYLILTHRRPDGDTLGCGAALAGSFWDAGKTAFILKNPETTERYLPFVEKYWAPDGFEPDRIITVDTASAELFPINGERYTGRVSLSIDHHPSNTGYAALDCLAADRASCGEVVYDILLEMYGAVSPEAAAALYVALSTDTGCFSFANTTANTLRVASCLADAGAPIRDLNRDLFRKKARGRILIEGMVISGLEFYLDGAVAVSSITNDMMLKAGATENDMDDIAAIPGGIDGVLVGVTIREMSGPRDCKVSIRTAPSVDANAIAARFDGGGHAMASGFSTDQTIGETKRLLLAALPDFLPPDEAE